MVRNINMILNIVRGILRSVTAPPLPPHFHPTLPMLLFAQIIRYRNFFLIWRTNYIDIFLNFVFHLTIHSKNHPPLLSIVIVHPLILHFVVITVSSFSLLYIDRREFFQLFCNLKNSAMNICMFILRFL
jgi:hypothetical protein